MQIFQNGSIILPSKRLSVQVRPERFIHVNNFTYFVHKICPISLVRQAIYVFLSLRWSQTSTKNLCHVNKTSCGSITLSKYSTCCVSLQHAIDWLNMKQITRDTEIFLVQQMGFVVNIKNSVLTSTHKVEFPEVLVDSTSMTLFLSKRKF